MQSGDSAGPDDGVWWVEHNGSLLADRVDPNGPGAKAGIKTNDQLVSVNGEDVKNTPLNLSANFTARASGQRLLILWFATR